MKVGRHAALTHAFGKIFSLAAAELKRPVGLFRLLLLACPTNIMKRHEGRADMFAETKAALHSA